MNLSISLEILAGIVVIELLIIFILLMCTYLFKSIALYRAKKLAKNKAAFEKYLYQNLQRKQNIDSKSFSSEWKHLKILMPVFVKMDEETKEPFWSTLKMTLLNTIILPLARKKYTSKNWLTRFFSARAFYYSSDIENEATIKLVKDPINLIYVHAIENAVKSKNEAAINLVITRLSNIHWLTQLFYLEPFKGSDESIQKMVVKRLQQETNPLARVVCYNILCRCPPDSADIDVNQDIQHENFSLRLAAAKYLLHINAREAVPMMLEKLQDQHWEIRLVMVHRLGMLKVKEAIPALCNCLHDKEWWVKISAAEALKNFGEEGEVILAREAPDLSKISFKATDHIPHTFW